MITEDYVSFETAKLLKEKGFDESVGFVYSEKGELLKLSDFGVRYLLNSECDNYSHWQFPFEGVTSIISAPTLQMAMRWLRDEKHYYIQVMLDGWACGGHLGYYVVIQKTDSDFEMMLQDAVDEVFFQTYEEACEAAINYCLENLI